MPNVNASMNARSPSVEAFFENRVLAVPQRQAKAKPLLVVGDSSQAVFAPSIRAGARLIVREIIPGVAAFAVIFANGSPLPLA